MYIKKGSERGLFFCKELRAISEGQVECLRQLNRLDLSVK